VCDGVSGIDVQTGFDLEGSGKRVDGVEGVVSTANESPTVGTCKKTNAERDWRMWGTHTCSGVTKFLRC
jgi:hypothetical protein